MFKGSGPQEVCSQSKPWSVEGDEPAKWGPRARLTSGQGSGHSVEVTTVTVHLLKVTTISVQLLHQKNCKLQGEGKLQRIPGLKEKEQRRIIFVCFSVFWTCNNVISILCTLLHKRMNPIPVKRSIVGLFYEWIVGLFYEWVVNLSLSVFEWGLVSTDSNEVTWMYFTVIIHLLYYKWKNEWIRLNLFSKNVRTWHNCIDVWYLFKHV